MADRAPSIPGQEATLNWPEQTEPRACEVCGGLFTADEWEDRHTTEDGPVHADCCVECPSGVEDVDVDFYDGSWRGTITRRNAPTLMFDGYDDLDGLLRAMAERIEP